MYEPPGDALEIAVVGKQWMWHLQHPEGRSEINELHVPLGQAGQADHDLAGRDPQLLRPRVPGQAGRAAGPVHDDVVRAVARSGAITSSAPSIAARTIRRWGAGSRSWSRPTFSSWLSEAGRRAVDGRGGRAALRAAPLRRLPPRQPDRARAQAGGGLRPAGADPGGQAKSGSSRPTTATSATRSSMPKAQVVAGYEPVMPSFKDQISEQDLLKIIAYIKSIGAEGATPMSAPAVEFKEDYLQAYTLKSWLLDHRPQADRPVVHGLDHVLLLRGRRGGDGDAARADDAAGRRAALAGRLQPALHHARRGHDLLLPDPVDPGGAGQLPGPAHDRRPRPGLSLAEPAVVVHLHDRRLDRALDLDLRRGRHRLDVLHAVQHDVLQHDGRAGGDGRVHHGVLVDPDRAELHRDDPHDAGAGDDLVPPAALCLVALCDQPDHGAGHAGAGDRGGA